MNRVGVKWGQSMQTGCTLCGWNPHEFSIYGAGGTGIAPAPCGCGDPIRRVGWCRTPSPDAALPPLAVVFCRRMSACVGAHWGTDWGSPCFRGRSSPSSASPIRGRTHLRYGLIRRLYLAEPVCSVSPMQPRILRWKRLPPSRFFSLRSSRLLAVLLADEPQYISSNRLFQIQVTAFQGKVFSQLRSLGAKHQ